MTVRKQRKAEGHIGMKMREREVLGTQDNAVFPFKNQQRA